MEGMERNSFNMSTTTITKDLKHKRCFMESHMKKSNNNIVKESSSSSSWDYYYCYYGNEDDDNDDDGVMCWPPRCYTCSFCKREFKSAQALGGHMNVHRRDRAKFLMRHHHSPPPPPLSSPPTNHNRRYFLPNTNPNPSDGCGDDDGSHEILRKYWGKGVVQNNELKSNTSTTKELYGVEKIGSFCMQENEFVSLDLEIGLFTQSKQDLDLELRLGYT